MEKPLMCSLKDHRSGISQTTVCSFEHYEANQLRGAGPEVIRDLPDRGEFGLMLLSMPGLEKRLMRGVIRGGNARFPGQVLEPSVQAVFR